MDPTDTGAIVAETNAWVTFAIDMILQYSLPVLGAIVILLIGWIISGWVNKLVIRAGERGGIGVALSRFLGQMSRWAVLVMTLIATLATVGIETTSFVAVLASAGFAVGLALQGTLGHFASGVLLMVFQPIRVGEYVSISGFDGTVDDIGLFATRLLMLDNRTIIISNGTVTGSTIINYSRQGTRRATIDVGVAYGSDLREVEQVCRRVAEGCSMKIEDKPVEFAFTEMASSSLNFELRVWCNASDYLAVLHEVRSGVYDALNEAGIEIPFPQVVVHRADEDDGDTGGAAAAK
jgi:small conductance mechanosensitive channel